VSFSSDPGKNEEKVGARVVAYLQIPEKIALIRTILGPKIAGVGWLVFQSLIPFVGLVAIPEDQIEPTQFASRQPAFRRM